MKRNPAVFITFKELEAWKKSPEGLALQEEMNKYHARMAKAGREIRKWMKQDMAEMEPELKIDALEDHVEDWQKGCDESLLAWQHEIEKGMKEWQKETEAWIYRLVRKQIANLKQSGDD